MGAQALWRSLDHGESWESLGTMPDGYPPSAVAVDPRNSSRLIAGGPHLYRSTDAGAHWTEIPPPTQDGRLVPQILQFDPRMPDRIYAGEYSLFRSDDAGSTWTPIAGELGIDTGLLAIDPHDSSRLYLSDGNSTRMFESRDSGSSWMEVSPAGSGSWLIGLAFGGSGLRYLVAASFDASRVYRSLDRGRSWSGVQPPLGGRPIALAVNPRSPERIYVTEGSQPSPGGYSPPPWYEALQSGDGGETYGPLTAGLDRYTYLLSIVVDSTGTYLYASDQHAGTWTYHIAGGAAPPVPTLSPSALALLAALIAAAGVFMLRWL